ncbi:nucleobase-ascorbate transporter 2 [Iris pallida]|uniref:Nucleobase-ascorbate transporter 2 n=1 Tax=Iris pallida TaxID=29817 RepID=A0AAX6DQS6_IRIPA|nr:nucleobase-ascorbate transporter 2 [Iris pallida]
MSSIFPQNPYSPLPQDFKVVILAGGVSKRLSPLLSKEIPKPLLLVANRLDFSYVLELVESTNLKYLIEVFFTPEGKGWGVHTLDELPKGSFVCEHVGEVLTNTELYNRIVQSTGNANHTYPVLLDADWGSEGVLKDEEALCLDATFYGNIARFVNHR